MSFRGVRYGLISDVHANLPALDAALGALAGAKVQGLLCAGDLVGYGPHPNECVERLTEVGARCVAGNHDLIAIGRLSLERTDALARRTLEWTREVISPATREALEGLPPLVEENGLVMTHGAIDDPQQYVLTDSQAQGQLDRLARELPAARVLVLGHTHAARAYATGRGALRLRPSRRVRLDGSGPFLLNPGSVGQARERRPVARAAVLDLEQRGEVSFLALRYDHARTVSDLVARGLPPGAAHRKPTLRRKAGALKAALRRGSQAARGHTSGRTS